MPLPFPLIAPCLGAMLISLRRLSVPELAVSLDRSILRHPSFVARLADYRGGLVEDRLFEASSVGTSSVPHWPLLALVLAGEAVVRFGRASAIVHRRDLVCLPGGVGFSARSGEQGVRVWIFQWDPLVFGGAALASSVHQRLAPSDFERIQGAIERSRASGYAVADCAAALVDVFDALRWLGLHDSRPAASDLVLPLPEPLARVGVAIDQVLSQPSRAPASIDLERALGCSPAQLRRWVHRYGATVAEKPPAWRDLLNGWRLAVGSLLMTAPKSSTERVAECLGYASPTAFCHAFANASLPSPGNIRRVVDALA